uniref:Cytochrome P450 n=1 Tax=Chromera velia CCMP2878 TaxID=1169474 RepID=A0A0G4I1M9_9ALVE|eukprot:Cvel_10159.t1-p1 / transcript=Cvel_10159.t1 / gene=Cvel_10159 / organism=Chromera_velia_CCMP2878 / gene_product=Cytochrome P450 97B3, chloroplastic, putative / transcript_product=Cytochrome P450 97B3, chloroplastic, putative / location=Cvel_scaffold606:30219-34804(-) / protein_length=555 / sequence_SO=supercontig / SO=protein_coding / is_pseudo=false
MATRAQVVVSAAAAAGAAALAAALFYLHTRRAKRRNGKKEPFCLPNTTGPKTMRAIMEGSTWKFHVYEAPAAKRAGHSVVYVPMGFFIEKKYHMVVDAQYVDKVLGSDGLEKHRETYAPFDHAFGLGYKNLVTRKSKEDGWHPIRKKLAPFFAQTNLSKRMDGIHFKLKEMLENFRKAEEKNEALDMGAEFTKLTVDVIAATAFDYDLKTQQGGEEGEAILEGIPLLLKEAIMSHHVPVRKWFPFLFPEVIKANKMREKLTDISLKILRLRREKEKETGKAIDLAKDNTLVARILEAEYESEMHRAADVMTFLFAGHDTTGFTLSWTVFELVKHPEKLRKAQQQIDALMSERPAEKRDGLISFEDFAKIPYIYGCIREAMRMWPVVVAGSSRQIRGKDLVLGDYLIPKGETIAVSQGALGRAAEWGDPNTYRPERWLSEGGASLEGVSEASRDPDVSPGRSTEAGDRDGQGGSGQKEKVLPISELQKKFWLPFSSGPRNCVGMNLALMEARVVLAAVLYFFDFEVRKLPEPGEEMQTYAIAKPKGGVWVVPRHRR